MNTKSFSIPVLALCVGLAACAGPRYSAPVIDRMPAKPITGKVGSDGFYTVQRGETLYSIASAFGLDWRDLAAANGISDPARLAVGQRLRVRGVTAIVRSRGQGGVAVNPVGRGSGGATVARPIESNRGSSSSSSSSGSQSAKASSGKLTWPHDGPILTRFRPGVNKGIDLAARVGDPVKASLSGKVVYSGNALRGYGNLVIVKHSNNLLTAYAHNKTLLVKEGDHVLTGQRIAEAGQSDSERPKIHFEVRRKGKPVDPLTYLPAR